MENVAALISHTVAIFDIDFTLYGFTMSMWDIFKWTFVAGVILYFLGRIFNDN